MSLSHICRVPWEAKRDLQSVKLELQGVERSLMCVPANSGHVSSTTGECLNLHTLSKKKNKPKFKYSNRNNACPFTLYNR